jgi:hypothetical protein
MRACRWQRDHGNWRRRRVNRQVRVDDRDERLTRAEACPGALRAAGQVAGHRRRRRTEQPGRERTQQVEGEQGEDDGAQDRSGVAPQLPAPVERELLAPSQVAPLERRSCTARRHAPGARVEPAIVLGRPISLGIPVQAAGEVPRVVVGHRANTTRRRESSGMRVPASRAARQGPIIAHEAASEGPRRRMNATTPRTTSAPANAITPVVLETNSDIRPSVAQTT